MMPTREVCRLYNAPAGAVLLLKWDAFLRDNGIDSMARRDLLHQLARWWCPRLQREGGRP